MVCGLCCGTEARLVVVVVVTMLLVFKTPTSSGSPESLRLHCQWHLEVEVGIGSWSLQRRLLPH